MASIKDVAERANVGRATVSRVLNDNGYVSKDTRERVLKAMEELDYIPNELARNLYRKRTGIVAIIVPAVSHPYFGEFVDYAQAELYKRGYKVLICNAYRSQTEEKEYLEMLDRHIVDGVISGVHTLEEEVYTKIKGHVVALDRYLSDDIPIVTCDNGKGGRLAAQALIDSGCTSVLHFRGNVVEGSPYQQRHIEFERMMKEHGIKTREFKLGWSRFDLDNIGKSISEVFEEGFDFDGVFGVDLLAIESMNECIRRGIRVPEDVKIVAYDGTYVTEVTKPEVTVVIQPVRELAKAAVEMITGLIDGTCKKEDVVLDVTFRKGKTTL